MFEMLNHSEAYSITTVYNNKPVNSTKYKEGNKRLPSNIGFFLVSNIY